MSFDKTKFSKKEGAAHAAKNELLGKRGYGGYSFFKG